MTGLVAGATWKHTIKGTTSDALASSVTTFTLDEGVYEVSEVQVVQTLNSADSAPAMFAMQITVDQTKPVIDRLGDVSVTHAHGTDYTDAGVDGLNAAAGETLATVITDSSDTAVGAVDATTAAGVYTYTYLATDLAGNVSDSVTRTVTVSPALSTVATLSGLTIAEGGNDVPLDQTFASGTLTGYTATVANNVDSITVTPTVTDTGKATVTVNGVAVVSGEASATIDLTLGENPIDIIVTAEDASTQTYTVTVARAVPPPGIALERDTAADGGVNTDRLTRNRGIAVTLHADFQDGRDTWQWSTNNGTDYTTVTDHSVSRFGLPEGSAEYSTDQVRVRQTVNGVVSEHAGLAAFTIDLDAPTVTLGTIAGAVINRAGQMHNITFSEDVLGLAADDFSTSTGITVTDVSGSGAAYTITYTATAASFTLTLTASGVTDIAANPVALTSKTGTATPHNTAPMITRTTGDDAVSYAEDRIDAVWDYDATDVERSAIAWSVGGTDAGLFSIDPTNGVLTFDTPPDFETPGSAATSNTYSVTITATETDGVPSSLASAPLAVTVTVTNVDEPGSIGAITGTAQVGQTLAAGAVTDEDSPADGTAVSVTGHEWQSAVDGTAANDPAWAAISGATDATYEPVVGDVDKIIRVVATYTDGHDSDKMLTSAPTDPVVSETAPVVPTIALAADTGADTSDGITSNDVVNVSGLVAGATWKHTINGTTSADLDPTATTTFTLVEGVYAVGEVQVVQTVNSVDSAPATFDTQITVDQTKPIITVDPDAVEVTHGSGTYNDQGVTVDTGETLVTTIAGPGGATTVDTDTLGDYTYTYTYTYTATDLAGNVSESVTRTVTVSPAPSTDSTLSALDVSEGTLNPTFASGTDAYAVSLDTGVTSIRITPTVTDTGKATVTVNGATVVSGEPSEAIDLILGNNPILVVVTAEDTSVTQTYTVTVARAVPPPGIALGRDTARDGGTNTDRITRNRSIVVTLHADFQNDRDTWEWSQDSGNAPSYTTGNNIERSFSPGAVQATYQNNVVGARQRVNGVTSEFAGLDQFTHDTVKPTISLNGGGTSVTIPAGVAYKIGDGDPATTTDVFDGVNFNDGFIEVTSSPEFDFDNPATGSYTLTYNVMDRAGNVADPLTRTVTVSEPVVTALALPAPADQSYTVDTEITALELPEAIGGTGDLSYTLTGPGDTALPTGLTFTAGTRTLSGTPTTAASATTLTYTVTDSARPRPSPPRRPSPSP